MARTDTVKAQEEAIRNLLLAGDLLVCKKGYLQILEAFGLETPVVCIGKHEGFYDSWTDPQIREVLPYYPCFSNQLVEKVRELCEDVSFRKAWVEKVMALHDGINAIHTDPTKRAGGLRKRELTPSIDGSFDRISMDMAPDFGSDTDYLELVHTARNHGAIVIGDIIPGHTGKGADFRLAERNYCEYPGIYHMVKIEPGDWNILPKDKGSPSSAGSLQRIAARYFCDFRMGSCRGAHIV